MFLYHYSFSSSTSPLPLHKGSLPSVLTKSCICFAPSMQSLPAQSAQIQFLWQLDEVSKTEKDSHVLETLDSSRISKKHVSSVECWSLLNEFYSHVFDTKIKHRFYDIPVLRTCLPVSLESLRRRLLCDFLPLGKLGGEIREFAASIYFLSQ